jgi:hypothetical protein
MEPNNEPMPAFPCLLTFREVHPSSAYPPIDLGGKFWLHKYRLSLLALRNFPHELFRFKENDPCRSHLGAFPYEPEVV